MYKLLYIYIYVLDIYYIIYKILYIYIYIYVCRSVVCSPFLCPRQR